MQITIHRGIDQIGGCIAEIATDQARIIIDFGQNLPVGNNPPEDSFADKEAVIKLMDGVDAVLYTHYHGDHIGLFHLVPDSVKQYVGQTAKEVALCKHRKLAQIKGREEQSAIELRKLGQMYGFKALDEIEFGDIMVVPYFVSHSACDSYMFLIEADGKRILHTGDFRGHGYLSKGLIPTIEKLILPGGKVDFLITEGTMLSRMDENVRTEHEVQQHMKKLMRQYKNVFVLCSSTDMERLASVYSANDAIQNRPFVCNSYQKEVLALFTAQAKSPLFRFDKVYDFRKNNTKLLGWLQDKGFCMLVRTTPKYTDYVDFLNEELGLNPDETVLIYSMWKEYINPNSKHAKQDYLDFAALFKHIEKLHTSGHASAEFLAEACNTVNPALGIIPIHSEVSGNFGQLDISSDLKDRIVTTSKTIDGIRIEVK